MFGFFQKIFNQSMPSGERELLPGGIDFIATSSQAWMMASRTRKRVWSS